jgi:hypothetical protein
LPFKRKPLGNDTVPFETKMTSAASIRTVGLLLAGSGVIWPTRAIGQASSERQARVNEALRQVFWKTPLPREARLALLQRTFFALGNKPP